MPWVPDGGDRIQKELAWCPGPESLCCDFLATLSWVGPVQPPGQSRGGRRAGCGL